MVLNMEISTKFAYLPNGIIRNIIVYTGATYKKRNGKYMGQIPKSDIRYKLLLNIPRNVVLNTGYTLVVNKNLTIRIIIYNFTRTIVEYEYYFKDDKTPIYYRPNSSGDEVTTSPNTIHLLEKNPEKINWSKFI